jgi:ribonucleoside-diphosphate reductase beta chain
MLLDPGHNLTLRPMRYPAFFERYRDAIRNTWSVEEVDFSRDLGHLDSMSPGERHLIKRLVAFFATGDSIVSNNLVLTLYRHLNAPEVRMYLSRQLFEEALHVQLYLLLLDSYIPDIREREEMFRAVETVPSIAAKAAFCDRWTARSAAIPALATREDRQSFVLTLIAFSSCVEGLFFFGAFAYVFWLRSRGLLDGLAVGTNWVFRDETQHMHAAFDAVDVIRQEEPDLFDDDLERQVRAMIAEAVDAEAAFAVDVLAGGLPGMTPALMRAYLESVADVRLARLGYAPAYGSRNPFDFMAMLDTQELANFFERRVTAYQTGIPGEVDFDTDF